MKFMTTLFLAVFVCAVEVMGQCDVLPVESARNGDFDKGYIPGDFNTNQTWAGPIVDNPSATRSCNWATANQFYISTNDKPQKCATESWVGTALNRDYGRNGIDGGGDVIMYIDPIPTASTATNKIWEQTVNIFPSQTYYFSFWALTINNPAIKINNFVLNVNGGSITIQPGIIKTFIVTRTIPILDALGNLTYDAFGRVIYETITGPVSWTQYYGIWNSTAGQTSTTISINVTDVTQDGYEFAVDKISFLNSCSNLTTNRRPVFASDTVNLCTTNGSANLTATFTGDPNPSNNTYSWYKDGSSTAIAGQTGLTYTGVSATGTYRICVQDPDNGCPASAEIVLIKKMSVTVSANDLCSPAISTVAATVTPTPTTGTYTYNWTGATPNPGNVASFTTSTPGTFSVNVSNAAVSGCNATSPNKTIVSLLPTYATPAVQCQGATAVVTGLGTGTNAANYKWWSAATGGTLLGSGANPSFTFPATGTTFSVYLEDATAKAIVGSPLGAIPSYDYTDNLNTNLTVTQPLILNSVDLKLIYNSPQTAQTYRIELFNTATSTVDQFVSYAVPYGTATTVPLNFKIPAGNYVLRIRNAAGNVVTDRFSGLVSSPSIPGVIQYSGQNASTGGPFGKFVLSQSNGCDRIKVDIPIQNCCTKPVITTQPADKTVCVDAIATFSIVLAGTPASTVVKWQETKDTTNTASFADISNITTSLTTTAAVIGDNAKWYRAVTVSTGSCSKNSWWAKLTVNPKPTVNAVSPAAICSGDKTNIPLVSTPTGAVFTWATPVSNPAGAVTGGASGTNVAGPIAQTLTNTTSATATLTYSVTATANGCTGAATDIVQTVKPLPIVSPVSPASICSGTSTNIVLASTPSGATFSWPDPLTQGGPITGGASGTNVSGPIVQILINPNTTKSFPLKYSITASLNGCTGPVVDILQPVGVVPIITSPAPAEICSGETTKIILSSSSSYPVYSGVTYSWTAPVSNPVNVVTGGSAGTTGGPNFGDVNNPIAHVLTNTTNTSATLTYTVTATFDGCKGVPVDIVQTVKPLPAVTPVSPAGICSGDKTNIALTSSIAGSTFSWTAPVSLPTGAITGGAAGTNVAGSIAQTLTNTTTASATLTYAVTAAVNGCTGAATSIVQTVNPAPKVNAVTPAAICSGESTNIALVSTPAGALFNWAVPVSLPAGAVTGGAAGTNTAGPIVQALSNATTSAATLTYAVTATANGCTGVATNIVQTVNPLPIVSPANPAAICSGTSTNISLTSVPAGGTFSWVTPVSVPAGAITGGNSGTNAAGPIVDALINTTSQIATLTYAVTATANGCTGAAANIVQTVNPKPTISSALTGATCNGAGFAYTITSDTKGATFTWSRAVVTGILPATGNGTTADISEILTSTNTTSTNVTYVLTPSAAGCTGTPSNLVVSVGPPPTITSPLTDIVCSGNALNYTITSSNAGAALSWDRAAVAGISNPALTAQTANPVTEVLTNTTSAAIVVTYKLTPTVIGCLGVPSDLKVTVNPSPTVNISNPTAICSGDKTAISLVSTPAGATFNWTTPVSDPVGAITGGTSASNVSGPIAQTLTNTSTAAATLTYAVTATANGCTGAVTNIVQTVNPKPVISSPLVGASCSGAVYNYTITSSTAGATFTWSRAVVAGITPATGSGTSSAISETLTNTNGTATSVTYILTPTAAGCPGTPSNLVVTVGPPPTITSASNNPGICSGIAQNYTITSSNAGATLTWDRAVVNGISNLALSGQTSNPITEALINTTKAPVVVTYVLTPTIPGCPGIPKNYTVTVNPTPTVTVVSAPASNEICNGEQMTLSGAGASTYSWDNGVVDGTAFSPSASKTYTVTGTDANGCINTAQAIITVNPLPVITPIPGQTICAGSGTPVTLLNADIANSTFTYTASATSIGGTVSGFSTVNAGISVTSIPSETINSNSTVQETVNYVIKVKSPKGCVGAGTQTFSVKVDAPAVATVSNQTLSSCSDPQALSGNQPPAGQTVKWNKLTGSGTITVDTQFNSGVSLNPGESGTFAMTVISGLCTATSPTVTVSRTTNETPSVSLNVDKIKICEGTAVVFTATPSGGDLATRTFEFVDANNPATILQAASTSNTYSPSPALTADMSVKVIMKANSPCLAPGASDVPESNIVKVSVDKNPDQPVFTNPATGSVTICTDSYNLAVSAVTTGTVSWSSDIAATFSSLTGITTTMSGITKGSTYIVTATNKNGTCPDKTAQVTITRSGDMTLANAGIDQEECYNAAGHIFTLAGNADASKNETGTWTPSAGNIVLPVQSNNTDATVNVLASGSYSYVYTISNGVCPSNSDIVVVKMLPQVDLNSLISSDEVCGNKPGQSANNAQIIIATAQSGATYTARTISGTTLATATAGADGTLLIQIPADQLPQDGANTIEVYGQIGGQCPQQLLINQPVIKRVGVISDVTPDVSFCADLAAASYQWKVVSTGAATYDWTPTPFINPQYSNGTATVDAGWPLNSGTVTVTPQKTDGTACTNLTYSENVNVVPLFDNTEVLDPLNPTICANDAVDFTITHPSANTTYTYTKPADATGTAIVNNGFTVNFPTSGQVIVARTYTACPAYIPSPLTVNITVTERPSAYITAVPLQSSLNEVSLDGTASTPIPQAGYTYTWTALSGGTVTGVNNTNTTKVTPTELVSYYQLLINANGSTTCASKAEVRVEVKVRLEFPNVFSPNGDGVHDFFAVKNTEFFHNAKMEIFNQWGDKVYLHKGLYIANWDGTHHGSELPVATYYYIYTPNEKGYDPVAGSISILR